MKKKGSTSAAKSLARTKKVAEAAATRHAARAKELLELIARRVHRIEEDFFDIGVALKELKEKKLHAALGFRTFDAMLAARAPIGRSQAYKLMAIVKKVTRAEALELGEEKAYAVAQLVAATPELDSVASVIEGGVRVGRDTRRAETMSRREIEEVKRKVVRHAKKRDEAERQATEGARAAQARLRARGVSAKIETAKRKGTWWAIVHLPVQDLPRLVRER